MLISSLSSLLLLGKGSARGRAPMVWCCVACGRRNTSRALPFLLPLQSGPSWPLWAERGDQPYPPTPHQVLEFSPGCLIHGLLLAGPFVRSTEVRNDLCHHLDDQRLHTSRTLAMNIISCHLLWIEYFDYI